MSEYWVVGGEFVDTNFNALSPGCSQERYGPFPDYDAARREWQARTMATVDNALVRYQIVNEQARAAA